MEYLEFEQPIKELEEQLQKCSLIGEESDVDVTNTCKQIEKKLNDTKKEIYKNLTPWQRVQALYFRLYQSALWRYLSRASRRSQC